MAANASKSDKNLKDLTAKELRTTRNEMLKRENWTAASAAGVETFRSYVRTLNEIQGAVRDLEKAQLKTALQQVKSLESDLRAGIDDLIEARKGIERVENFVAATGKVLELVAKSIRVAA